MCFILNYHKIELYDLKTSIEEGLHKMNKRKINQLLIAVGVFAVSVVNTFAVTFKDVPQTHWAYNSMIDMQKKGIMLVNSAGEFFPSATMNFFDIADVLAKATGYVDVNVTANIDATFKQQLISNSQIQKPVLAVYETKFTTWDKRYNEQIAYLLGRGYLKKEELDLFMTKTTTSQEVKNTLNKQQLAVFIVRVLGKEQTATTQHTTTDFSDDAQILALYKPYIAYLRSIGLVNPDAKGLFNPNVKVTRALCAKMVSDALVYKEKQTQGTTTTTTTTTTNTEFFKVNKVIAKGDTEHWVVLEKDGKTDYYVIKNTTKATTLTGQELAISEVALETQADIVSATENGIKYIISMKLQANAASTTNSTNTTDTVNATNTSTLTGVLTRIGLNQDISILLADESSKSYFLDPQCVIMIRQKAASLQELKVGDRIQVTIKDSTIIKIELVTTSADTVTSDLSDGEISAKTLRLEGYGLSIKQGTRTTNLVIDRSVTITRNNRRAIFEDLRIGDQIKIVKENGSIIEVIATGNKTTVTGQVSGIYIASIPQVQLKVQGTEQTFTLNTDTEIYDNNQRQEVSLRDVRLGQNVELLIDSKEVVSLVIERSTTGVRYAGEIYALGERLEYIDVLVDYDPLTGNSRVLKRIKTPVQVPIELSGRDEHRTIFEAGMNLVITYDYLDDILPQKILIIK